MRQRVARLQRELPRLLECCMEGYRRLVSLRACLFFADRSRSVEVFWAGRLYRIFYPCPKDRKYLESELPILTAAYRSYEPRDKLSEFVVRTQNVLETVSFSRLLDTVHPLPMRLGGSLHDMVNATRVIEWVSFAVGLVASLNILLGLNFDQEADVACWFGEAMPDGFCGVVKPEDGGYSANATNSTNATGFGARRLASKGGGSGGGMDIVAGPSGTTDRAHATAFSALVQQHSLHLALGFAQLTICCAIFFLTLLKRMPQTVLTHWSQYRHRDVHHLKTTFRAELGEFVAECRGRIMVAPAFCFITLALYSLRYPTSGWPMYALGASLPLSMIHHARQYFEAPDTYGSLVSVVVYDIITDPKNLANILMAGLAVAGLIWPTEYWLFSLHLLRVAVLSPLLANVLKAVILPWKSLLLTFVFIVMVVYLFALWGFLKVSQPTAMPMCAERTRYISVHHHHPPP